MRILHVLDHSLPLHSGYTFRSCAIFKAQRALGWHTDHITSAKHNQHIKHPIVDREEIDGLCFYRTPDSKGLFSRLPGLREVAVIDGLTRRLDEVVRRLKPDLLHAHSPALNGVATIRVARRNYIPIVYEVRAFWEDAAVDHGTVREGGPRYRLSRSLENWVIKRANAVTTICQGLRHDLIARGFPPHKITVIPNGVDPLQFKSNNKPDPELVRAHGLEGKQVLGFVGSFYAYEGLTLLLQALPHIVQAQPQIRVLLVGGGPQEAMLKRLARDLNIADKVIFAGRVAHDLVADYYEMIDILVYPRLPMRLTETVTPLKPLEAMACGRLVAASDVGGHRELIRVGETGELFKAGDQTALVQVVLRMLKDKNRWPMLSQAARHYVESERSWSASVARYIPIYEALGGMVMPPEGWNSAHRETSV